jgi:hypothetical protein
VLINPIIRTRTRYFRHAYHPTHDNIKNDLERKKERNTLAVASTDWERDVKVKRFFFPPDRILASEL